MNEQWIDTPSSGYAPGNELDPTLWPEIALTREVLDGLMGFWRQQPPLSLDEVRRFSVLVFNGARTVAILLTHQLRLNTQTPDNEWLTKALEELGREIDGE
jgi:hypothetical protein